MDYNAINNLIEKYFEGATNPQEERQLEEYFNSGTVAKEHEVYTPLFAFIHEEKQRSTSPGFEQRLFDKIQPVRKEAVVRKINRRWLSVAAAIVFTVGMLAVLRFWNIPDPTVAPQAINWEQYEPESPDAAYDEMMKALALMSEKMNEGEAQTLKVMRKLHAANEQITN